MARQIHQPLLCAHAFSESVAVLWLVVDGRVTFMGRFGGGLALPCSRRWSKQPRDRRSHACCCCHIVGCMRFPREVCTSHWNNRKMGRRRHARSTTGARKAAERQNEGWRAMSKHDGMTYPHTPAAPQSRPRRRRGSRTGYSGQINSWIRLRPCRVLVRV